MRREPADDATLMRIPAPPGDGLAAPAADGLSPDIAPADSTTANQTPPVLPGDDAPLPPGERVGPYEVRAHIGDGGMASVYRAWHTGLHRFEALKIPRQQGRYGPEAAFVRRLLTEARTVAGLHHPHIALIHAVSEADSPLQYFAMELIDGGDLADFILAKGKVPPEEAIPILKQIGEALDYAHANGVVHRDIKPANVLLTADGNAKVVDFGISRAGEEAGGTRLTRSGMMVGTPEYMSPEQSGSGDPVTHLTDVYSLGVVAYEMLCGVPPFVAGEGVNRISILMKHLGEAPASPLRSIPGFGPAATEALLTALAKKPADRFANCGEFVAALSRALQKRGRTQLLPSPGTPANGDVETPRPLTLAERTGEPAPAENEELAPKRAVFVPRPITRRRPGAALTGVAAVVLGILFLLGWWQRKVEVVGTTEARKPAAPRVAALAPPRPTPAHAATSKPVPAPPVTSPVAPKPTPRPADRITTRVITRTSAIPFAHRTRPDANLMAHTTRVIQHGQPGVRETKLQITSEGPKVLALKPLSSRVLRAPVDQITAVGTKAPAARKPAPRKPAPRKPPARRGPPTHRPGALRRPAVIHKPAARRRAIIRTSRPHRAAPRRVFGHDAPLPP